MQKKNKDSEIMFHDFPKFRPNLTPKEIFELGSFGGTYWRPIKSKFYKSILQEQHLKYPKTWWKNIPDNWLTNKWDNYDNNINKYKVQVGTTLQFWEDKNWIANSHPYGWVQWYCDFYSGHRSDDDERQINRWVRTAGPKSRFRRMLINLINNKKTSFDDFTVSPKIRQTLQHWGCVLTNNDLHT